MPYASKIELYGDKKYDQLGRKKCNDCGRFRYVVSFSKNERAYDSLQTICKLCAKERRDMKRDSIAEKIKQWKIDNREYVNTYRRAMYEKKNSST